MKKILILTYYFPPYEHTGGQRAFSWYTYFKKNKLYPIVVTRHWNTGIKTSFDSIKPSNKQTIEQTQDEYGTVIRVPFNPDRRDQYHLLKKNNRYKKIINLISKIRFFSLQNDKTASIYHEACNYLKNHTCDFIIATGAPFITFRYAYLLSNQFNIPWIADYRDGWSTNVSFSYSGFFKRTGYQLMLKKIEQWQVNKAIAITVAADPYQHKIQPLFPNKKMDVVYNGYNPDYRPPKLGQAQSNPPSPSSIQENTTTCFTIAYAGAIYPFQELELFLKGFKLFTEEMNDIPLQLIFYGSKYEKKRSERLANFDSSLNRYIIQTELLNKATVMKKLAEADVCLLLSSTKVETLASKIFDYMALNKKILLVPKDASIMTKIVQEYTAGRCASTPLEIKNNLLLLYKIYKTKQNLFPDTIYCEQYSWENQVKKMASILHSL